MNKQNRNRPIDTENRLIVARREGTGGLGEKHEGIEKHKMVVTKQSWRCEVRHRKYSNNTVIPMVPVGYRNIRGNTL